MAIEKVITPDLETPSVQIPTDEDIQLDEAGNAEVTLQDDQALAEAEAMGLMDDMAMPMATEHDANLVEFMDDNEIAEFADDMFEGYQTDKEARGEYDEIAEDGVNLLGLSYDDSSQPFPGACGSTHPVLAQSVVKFQAKAFKELFPTEGPVRTRIMGVQSDQKLQQANRVRDFMNWQTQVQMPEYGPELDRLLFHVALYGSAFKKTYWDATSNRPRTEYVKAQDFYVDYYASNLETAERFTHKYTLSTNQIKKLQLAGLFAKDVDFSEDAEISESGAVDAANEAVGLSKPGNNNDRVEILEMHVEADVPGFEDESGINLPYIVYMTADQKVLSIRRNWDEEDPFKKKKLYFTHYTMIPGLGFYGYGYLHLIGGLTKTATSSMRQLIDAGTFANLPGGFKAHGLRVLAPDEPIAPGEWREVNSPAGDLGKSLQPLPFKEPSQTLFNLMQYVTNAAREFADATDNVVESGSNYGPVGTTMALLEQSSKLFAAVHKRMHEAQTKDLRILCRLDQEYLPESYPYEVAGGAQQVFSQDFNLKSIDVIPVSDPNMPTEAHRIAKINAIMSIAQQNPSQYNMQLISQELFSAMGVEDPKRYLAQSQPPFTGDPITENMAAMKGAPLKASIEQNHDAHIIVHGSMLQNPTYGDNQQMKQILMAHIQDHLTLKYRQEMAQMIPDPEMQQMIMSNPPQQQPGQPKQAPPKLPPELENQIAMMAANAADSVLQLDEEKAKIMAGEKKDPQIELQEKDLALRAQKMMNDLKVHEDKMALEEAQTIIKDENTDEDRELRKEKIMIDQLAKESEMLMKDKNKDADRQQQIIEKAMDVAAQTGANAIKISGNI
jgi:hypothetical protein